MKKPNKKLIFLITFWPLIVILFLAHLHTWHWVDLSPQDDQFLTDIKSSMGQVEHFGVIHFLTPECSCSQVVTEHLLKRGPLAEATELVVVVDDFKQNPLALKFEQRGYPTLSYSTKLTVEENQRPSPLSKALKGVPLLVIFDSQSKVQYMGGYTERSITPFTEINIKALLNEIKATHSPLAPKPVIGCAVSEKYQKLLDPLGLKYTIKEEPAHGSVLATK